MAGGSQDLKSENISAFLENRYGLVDACKNMQGREVLVMISIGNVQKKDSLFGFDFEIKYDPGKIRFTNYITMNTLAEFFQVKDMFIRSEDSVVSGFAMNLNPFLPPVEGDRPLAGVYGQVLSECPDSSELSINSLEFTEEFKNKVNSLSGLKIYSKILDKPDRIISAEFDKDSIKFDKDSIAFVELKSSANSNSRIQTLQFEFDIEKYQIYKIVEAVSLTDSIEIVDKEITESKFRINILNKNSKLPEKLLRLKIERKYHDSLACLIKLSKIEVDDCACVSQFKTDSLTAIDMYRDTTVNVIDDKAEIDIRLETYSNRIVIRSVDKNIDNLKLYDLMGRIIIDETINNSYYEKNIEALLGGTYIAVVEQNGKRKNKILIKN